MSAGLTFFGFNPHQRAAIYKGITGRSYAFSINIPAGLNVAHGTTLTAVNADGTPAGNGGAVAADGSASISSPTNLFTVVGVAASPDAAGASTAPSGDHSEVSVGLPCDLWLHEHGSLNPTLVKNVSSGEDLHRRGYAVAEQVAGATPFLGPLGISYQFQTSGRKLSAIFGVVQDERYYLKALNSNVRIVGELMGILWVARDDEPMAAVPLPGCSGEDSLHGLYGVCEPLPAAEITANISRGNLMPSANQLVSTPRRATLTPRRAGGGQSASNANAKGGGTASGIVVDNVSGLAMCSGPMGIKLKLDIKASGLGPFGVVHNQRMVSRVGIDAGKLCRVVGVSNGALYVLFDGDSRVTCVRNCEDAEAVKKQFSMGGSGGGGAADNPSITVTATPMRSGGSTSAFAANSSRNQSSTFEDAASPASPRIAEKVKQFWTTFGRLEFDTSDKACAVFGYHHGQVVRGGAGAAKGKMFTIVGARLGNMWVLEEGKYRATALVHCTNKAEITAMYGLVPTGAVKDLKLFYDASVEPPATPMHTPRFRLSQSPQRGSSVGGPNANANAVDHSEHIMPPLSPRGPVAASPAAAAAPTPIRSSSVELSPPSMRGSVSPQLVSSTGATAALGGLPGLNFGAVQRDTAPLPTVVGGGSIAQFNTNLNDANTHLTAATSPAAIALTQPSAREYLKAWALLKMGHRSTDSNTSLTFHQYYMEDTVRRIGEAFAKLPRARQVWQNENRVPEFYAASTQDLLKFLHERPSVSAY